jgi:hypothetical protein
MAIVNQVKKVVKMDLWDIIRFQIFFYCYINKFSVSEQNLDCLTLLALTGDQELGIFCDSVAEHNIFKNSQSTRTSLPVLEKKNLILTYKNGKEKKRIKLNENLNIQITGNILLDFKIVRIESENT